MNSIIFVTKTKILTKIPTFDDDIIGNNCQNNGHSLLIVDWTPLMKTMIQALKGKNADHHELLGELYIKTDFVVRIYYHSPLTKY